MFLAVDLINQLMYLGTMHAYYYSTFLFIKSIHFHCSTTVAYEIQNKCVFKSGDKLEMS